MDLVEQMENKIYLYIIKSFGFLHTLKKKNLLNGLTDQLSMRLGQLNELYNQAIETTDKNEKNILLHKTLNLLDTIHEIYMNMHLPDESGVLFERADLQVETSFLARDIKKLLTQISTQNT